jgi:DNA repair exonuclease SbcCD ATPase subunit
VGLVIAQLRRRYEQRVGRRDQLREHLDTAEQALRRLQRQIKIAEQAQLIVRAVALETQRQLEYRISQVVTTAEEAVFDDQAYNLFVDFVERRGKTECDLFFSRNDKTVDPLAGAGFGATDIASFALRCACWGMMRNVAPILICDEPMKHLKGIEANRRVIQMIREISNQLGLQIIMISDERISREDIIEGSDQVFEVSINNGVSHVQSAGP